MQRRGAHGRRHGQGRVRQISSFGDVLSIENATKGKGRLDAGPFAYMTALQSGERGMRRSSRRVYEQRVWRLASYKAARISRSRPRVNERRERFVREVKRLPWKTFFQKVIDGLLKLAYTDKCRWQAFPPSRKPSDASLSFADPAAGLFSSGPAVSAGRRGFHTPLSTLVGHFSLLELPVNPPAA